MPPTVNLSDIIEAFEAQSDESASFLNLDTGEVDALMYDYLRSAEESDEPGPQLMDREKDLWELAKRIVSTDRFIKLPTKYDVHEWEIMRDFANSAARPRRFVRNSRTRSVARAHSVTSKTHFDGIQSNSPGSIFAMKP
jgi:hypothetical protein